MEKRNLIRLVKLSPGAFVLFFLLLNACQKEKAILPVEVEFDLLDENGVSSKIFNEGENFRFQLILRNNSSSQISFKPTFIDDDFFRVFETKSNSSPVLVGAPYQSVFCTYIGDHFVIPPDSEYRFEIPWNPSEHHCCPPFCLVNKSAPLAKGKFRTTINGPFDFIIDGELTSINKVLNIDFEIKAPF